MADHGQISDVGVHVADRLPLYVDQQHRHHSHDGPHPSGIDQVSSPFYAIALGHSPVLKVLSSEMDPAESRLIQ